jgi:hypothetical protein
MALLSLAAATKPLRRSLVLRLRVHATSLALIALFCASFPAAAADPQTLPEDQNAVPSPTSPLLLCVLDDSAMADLLIGVSNGKIVNGRSIAIRAVKLTDDLHRCQVLFVSVPDQRKAAHILASLKGAPVLTVGESPGFIQVGGIVNFSVQDSKIRLELDLDSANRAGLKISAKLIAVSKLVSGSPGGSN